MILGASEAMTDDDPTFLKKPLMTLSFVAACCQSSPLRKRGPLGFSDFADVPIVVYEDDKQLMEQVIGRIEGELGFDQTVPKNHKIHGPNGEPAQYIAVAGEKPLRMRMPDWVSKSGHCRIPQREPIRVIIGAGLLRQPARDRGSQVTQRANYCDYQGTCR